MEYKKKLWQYSLLDKVYFLVNFQNSQTRVVYWGNMGKYTPSRAGPILAIMKEKQPTNQFQKEGQLRLNSNGCEGQPLVP